MNFIDFFVVKLRFVSYRDHNSPFTFGILFHCSNEEIFRTSVKCCIRNPGGQILGMTGAIVFITNQIAHDLETRCRIFVHRYGQDLSRIARIIAIFNAVFMATFTLANFALVTLTYFNALFTFAFRNNDRRFIVVQQSNRHQGGYREFSIRHLDQEFKLVFKNAGVFKVQSFFISDSNFSRLFIYNSKRDIVIRIIIFIHRNRIIKRIECGLDIIVSGFHFTNKSSHRRIFLNIERSHIRKVRFLIHVCYGDFFVNRNIQTSASLIRKGQGHIKYRIITSSHNGFEIKISLNL